MKKAIDSNELAELHYYSPEAFKERDAFSAELSAIESRVKKNNKEDAYIHLHFPAYWGGIILGLIDSIRRIVPAARFRSIKEEDCGLAVEVEGYDHSRYEEIKTLLLTARANIDNLVQIRIKNYRKKEKDKKS